MRLALVLIVCVAACNGWVSFENPNPKAGDGKCVSASYEFGDFNAGQKKQVPGICAKATCNRGGSIDYEGCGVVGIPAGCKFVEPDLKAPFPKCCKYDFTCPDQ